MPAAPLKKTKTRNDRRTQSQLPSLSPTAFDFNTLAPTRTRRSSKAPEPSKRKTHSTSLFNSDNDNVAPPPSNAQTRAQKGRPDMPQLSAVPEGNEDKNEVEVEVEVTPAPKQSKGKEKAHDPDSDERSGDEDEGPHNDNNKYNSEREPDEDLTATQLYKEVSTITIDVHKLPSAHHYLGSSCN